MMLRNPSAALFVLLVLAGLVVFSGFPVTADSAESAKEKYKKVDRELRQQKKKLEQTKKVEASVIDELKKVAEDLREVNAQHKKQQAKIRSIQEKIAEVEKQIGESGAAMEAQREYLKKRLRALQKVNNQSDALIIILTTEDIGKSMRLLRYLRDISAHDKAVIQKYQGDLQQLAQEQEKLKQLRISLQAEERQLAKVEDSLKEKQRRRESLLAQVRKDKATYEHLIQGLKEDQNRLSRIMQELDRKDREKRKATGKPPAKSKTRDDVYEDSTFTRMKGKLPWPVSGSVAVSYGSQVDPIFNLPVFRSGITIKASSGVAAKAVAEGKVVYADAFKGYGQLVIVSHGGGYHTLYGNLSKIFSHNGAIIKENQAVGEVGESQAIGTSGLYFELRYKGKPLDPQQWLGRR